MREKPTPAPGVQYSCHTSEIRTISLRPECEFNRKQSQPAAGVGFFRVRLHTSARTRRLTCGGSFREAASSAERGASWLRGAARPCCGCLRATPRACRYRHIERASALSAAALGHEDDQQQRSTGAAGGASGGAGGPRHAQTREEHLWEKTWAHAGVHSLGSP